MCVDLLFGTSEKQIFLLCLVRFNLRQLYNFIFAGPVLDKLVR